MRFLVQLTDIETSSSKSPGSGSISFSVDGTDVTVPDEGRSLLDVLSARAGTHGVKDGCSPQGQCGCCTVLVDGAARVSCVTPVRRIAGRSVTTVDGLDPAVRTRWADAMVAAGASQCGFCTPGIVMRLAALDARLMNTPRDVDTDQAVRSALLAHLCRCTGWQTIVEAARVVIEHTPPTGTVRDPVHSQWRAQLEGRTFQTSGPDTVLGRTRFALDSAPANAVVAVPDEKGTLVTGANVGHARTRIGKIQGRRSTVARTYPLTVPDGAWDLTLRTTWVEPAYLEPDASWSAPNATSASPLANGGAFGGKREAAVTSDVRRLADSLGETVAVVWSREDVVRRGPKRPPVAAGIRADGTGILHFAQSQDERTASAHQLDADHLRARVRSVAPGLDIEVVPVPGPPTSLDLRGVGWVEATVLVNALEGLRAGHVGPGFPITCSGPSGGRARVTVEGDGGISVEVWAGEVLDAVTLRSYCIGAVHQALGWVWSEGISVDENGTVQDLTIRSFGILSAREMPHVDVVMHPSDGWPVNGSDAVFAATAAAAWLAEELPQTWPTRGAKATSPVTVSV